jgi:transglutaminase-like putative cysteine protease
MPVRKLILWTLLGLAPATAQESVVPATPTPPGQPPASAPAAPAPQKKSAFPDRPAQERALRDQLEKLPPEKRRQVLEAMKAVWADEDVRAARESLRQATETYRRTLRTAIEETDPEVRTAIRPLLDRLLKAGLNPADWTESAPTDKPAQDSPPRYLRLLGLSGPAAASLTPEERTLLASVREQVMSDPRVRQATAAVAAASDQPRARAQAMQALRRTTRAVAVEREPRLQPLLDKAASPKP